MWKKFLREYLSFTRRQRRGIYVLISIILLCIIISYFLPFLFSNKTPRHAAFQREVKEFLAKQKHQKTHSTVADNRLFYFDPNKISPSEWHKLGINKHTALTIQHYLASGGHFYEKKDLKNIYGLSDSAYRRLLPYVRIEKEQKKEVSSVSHEIHLHSFDPNRLSSRGWVTLGLSEHTAQVIRNYIKAGGHFYKKEDLKKIYGFSSTDYKRLSPYVEIANIREEEPGESISSASQKKKEEEHQSFFLIDINKADSADWCRLYGIGPVFSSRIVRFRNALGGFYKIDQIAEVYGLPDSTFRKIKSHLRLEQGNLKKININKATFQDLNAHPYISYSMAKAIVSYRKQHGKYRTITGLQEIQIIKEKTFKKIKPYLRVE